MKINSGLIILFCFLPAWLFSQPSKPSAQAQQGVAVIELFTSQGDINSPAADKILSEIIADAEKNNKEIYCLSMHVDFWNRYGWMDPFSNLKYTRRLTNYTSVLEMKETYTPLMLLNGRTVLPVSDKNKVMENIESALLKNALYKPDFSYTIFNDTLDVSYNIGGTVTPGKSGSNKYVNVAVVEKGLSTAVTKGDNNGKTLKNDNVTRLFYTTDLKTAKGLIRIPLKAMKPGVNKKLILFVQEKSTKKVLGAASVPFQTR